MTDTAAQPFAPGDIVRLKSGSPFLTVYEIEGEVVEVMWIDDKGVVQAFGAPPVCFQPATTPAQSAGAA